MTYIICLEKALKYIEENLKDEIELGKVAEAAGYSLFHFQRIFKGAIGESLKEYIRKRRLTEAARELSTTDIAIVDLAVKYGYQSREAFSRAFTSLYGIMPSKVREMEDFYHNRAELSFDSLMFEYTKRSKGLQPIIRKLPRRYVVGYKYKMYADGSNYKQIPWKWNEWNNNNEISRIKHRKAGAYSIGICLPSDGEHYYYMIGCEVDIIDDVPEGMELELLEECTYAVFSTVGPIVESVQKTWDYIYGVWINDTEYELLDLHDMEYYYRKHGELCADLYVPIRL